MLVNFLMKFMKNFGNDFSKSKLFFMGFIGSTFFLINSNSPINLTNKDLILLFGSTKDFINKINSTYKRVNWNKQDGICTVVSDNGILDFYFGDDEVIEKFVVVDVSLTDTPFTEVINLCKKYNWLLFNLDKEAYVDISN